MTDIPISGLPEVTELDGNELVPLSKDGQSVAAKVSNLPTMQTGPGVLQFAQASYTAREEGVVLQVLVMRYGGSTGQVGVSYATENGSAMGGADFVPASGTLIWDDGDFFPKAIEIEMLDDAGPEGDEEFTINIYNPTGGAVLGTPSMASVVLTEAEEMPVPGEIILASTKVNAIEGDGVAAVGVERIGGSLGAASVTLTTSDDTAVAGTDYTATTETVNWADGEMGVKYVNVPIADDSELGGPRRFNVTLSGASGASLSYTGYEGSVTIVDDDGEDLDADPFALPDASDRIPVTFHPKASVTAGETALVAFGFPIPPGLVSSVDNIRVLDSTGTEIAAHVEEIVPWRVFPGWSGASTVRSALVWCQITFADLSPVNGYVEYGVARTLQLGDQGGDPTVTWTLMTNNAEFPNEYPAVFGVKEPRVYVTLPPSWLCRCNLRVPTSPFYADPNRVWLDEAFEGFSYTAVNDVADGVELLIPYQEDYEPWLYDRAATLWNIYFRTGDVKWLQHAHRASNFVGIQTSETGWFLLRNGGSENLTDFKSTYNFSPFLDLMMTGDTSFVARMEAVAAQASVVHETAYYKPYRRDMSFWTERHYTYALRANLVAWELTGNAAYATKVTEYIDDLRVHQAVSYSTYAGIPWPVLGGFMHTIDQHEGGGGSAPVGSPWMSNLLSEEILRYWLQSRDWHALDILAKMGQWIADDCITYKCPYDPYKGKAVPWYLASSLYHFSSDGALVDAQHCLDVGVAALRGAWAQAQLGADPTVVMTAAHALLESAEIMVWEWYDPTRPERGGPIWKASPPREYNWLFGATSDYSWLENALAAWFANPGTVSLGWDYLEASESDGEVSLTVNRQYGSAGAASVQWRAVADTALEGDDFVAASGTVEWADGEAGGKIIRITLVDDAYPEDPENFTIELFGPSGVALGSVSVCTVRITDTDTPLAGALQFSAATYTVAENGGPAVITVNRTGGSQGAIAVDVNTSDGTAVAGSDYTAVSTTLSWADGDTDPKTFQIPIADDSVRTGDRTVNIALSNPTNGSSLIEPTAAVLTIQDDEWEVVFTDDFNRADSQDLGSGWSDPDNAWEIVSNQIKPTATGQTGDLATVVDVSLSDLRIDFDIDQYQMSYGAWRIRFCDNGVVDRYYLRGSPMTPAVYLYRKDSISEHSVASATTPNFTNTSGLLPVRIERVGANITVTIDGVTYIDYTDDDPLGGGTISLERDNNYAFEIDNFTISTP